MIRKTAAALLLSLILVAAAPLSGGAALSRGDFTPCSREATADRQIRVYQVKKGDTIWGIARQAGVDTHTILSLNNLKETSIITEGQYIDIPYSKRKLHRVKEGESLWVIARSYGISLDLLTKCNSQLENPHHLKVGEVVNIPESATFREAVYPEYPSRHLRNLLSWPVMGAISSGFGKRRGGFHHGIDIAAPLNTLIRAADAGQVVFVGVKPVYGRTVIIKHANGTQTLYAHARRLLVYKGQKVKKGQAIGRVGVSGRTTGPHVHFEFYRDGRTVNPLVYIRR